MKKALITGITGQDGSYLAELLLEKGYEVHGIVRRASVSTTSRIDHILDKLIIHEGDLSDSSSIIRIVLKVQPDEIYNLAAQSHVQVSFEAAEYTGDVDPAFGVCNTDSVLSRMPLNELKEFVNDPLSDEVICLDNDNEQPRLRLSDDQVWEQIMKLTGTSDATGFQLLEREQQKIIIRKIRRLGASIRQLERLTGISRGVIQALA